jgi:hypothetical protein
MFDCYKERGFFFFYAKKLKKSSFFSFLFVAFIVECVIFYNMILGWSRFTENINNKSRSKNHKKFAQNFRRQVEGALKAKEKQLFINTNQHKQKGNTMADKKEIFADGIGQIHFTGGMVRFDFMTLQPDEDGKKPAPQSNIRIIMPPQGFLTAFNSMQQLIDKLVEAKVLKKNQKNQK